MWADLWYALDELERPWDITTVRLTDFVDYLDEQTRNALRNKLQIFTPSHSSVYFQAIVRAQARSAHEAIEKGLKAILIDAGWTNTQKHDLHELLANMKQLNPGAFSELKRCFDSVVRYLKFVSVFVGKSDNILDYFRDIGNQKIFVGNRYASITGGGIVVDMIVLIHVEVMRALLWLLFDWVPGDIESRIEEAARKAVLAEGIRNTAWDAEKWVNQGPVRPRMQDIGNLSSSKVLRAAIRKCAKESSEREVQSWAMRIRRDYILAKRKARDVK